MRLQQSKLDTYSGYLPVIVCLVQNSLFFCGLDVQSTFIQSTLMLIQQHSHYCYCNLYYFLCLMCKAHLHTSYSSGFLILLFLFRIIFGVLLLSQRCQHICKKYINTWNDREWCALTFQKDSPNGFHISHKE